MKIPLNFGCTDLRTLWYSSNSFTDQHPCPVFLHSNQFVLMNLFLSLPGKANNDLITEELHFTCPW